MKFFLSGLSRPEIINKRIENSGLGVIDIYSEKYKDKIFGVVLRDTVLRTRPSSMRRINENGFDLNAETLCRCCEPVILLDPKPKNGFYCVHTVSSYGFLPENSVAVISRADALHLLDSKKMLYITDKFVLTCPSPDPEISKLPLSFGTRVPLKCREVNYRILLPYRLNNGKAGWKEAEVPVSLYVHPGPLKFTRKNILGLSLRMRGMPYDWGESFGGCDCSSLVCAAFSLCGVHLPRNTDKMAKITKGKPVVHEFRRCHLKSADIILCDGHVALYYGRKKGIHYVFHSFYGTKGITDITPISEPTSKGTPLYESFKKIIPLSLL